MLTSPDEICTTTILMTTDEYYECFAPAVRAARCATYAMFFADGLGFGI